MTNENTYRNKWIILASLLLLTLMCCIDASIVNVALPDISIQLGAPAAQVEFIAFSYLFAATSTMLIFGRLGDVIGKTKVFRIGILFFTIGSLLCGLCDSLVPLIICRIIQGFGAAAAMATNMGIITQTFPASQRGQALGISGSVVAIGTMLGPALGGLIVSTLSWEYIFFINVPIGIISIVSSFWVLNFKDEHAAQNMDFPGAAMIVIVMISFCSIIVIGQTYGFVSWQALIAGLATVALFIVFTKVENHQPMPLIDMTIFKNTMLTISLICGFLLFVCNATASIIMPLYLENALGYAPGIAGLILAFSPLIIMVLSPLSGRLSDKIGAQLLTTVGTALCALGMGLIACLNASSVVVTILCATGIMSCGWALFQSPNNSLIMSFAPKERLGIIGSINGFVRNAGMAIGVSSSTSLLFAIMSNRLGYQVDGYVPDQPDAFFFAFCVVFIIMCSICVLAAALNLWRLLANRSKAVDDIPLKQQVIHE